MIVLKSLCCSAIQDMPRKLFANSAVEVNYNVLKDVGFERWHGVLAATCNTS